MLLPYALCYVTLLVIVYSTVVTSGVLTFHDVLFYRKPVFPQQPFILQLVITTNNINIRILLMNTHVASLFLTHICTYCTATFQLKLLYLSVSLSYSDSFTPAMMKTSKKVIKL